MSDTSDTYRALKTLRQEEGAERRARESEEPMSDHELREFAKSHGFIFTRLTGGHYVLRGGQGKNWKIDIWPSRPMYKMHGWTHGFLNLASGWSLEDVVRAVAERLETITS